MPDFFFRLPSIVAAVLLGSSIAFACTDALAAKRSAVEDPCELSFNEMTLKKSWIEEGQHYGSFEVQIASSRHPKEPTVFAGQRDGKGFHVEEPEVSFEFKDVNGAWHALATPPGVYLGLPDRLSVPFGARGEVIVALPPVAIAASVIEWRMLLRSHDNRDCKRSSSFRVLQQRGPVTGFEPSASAPLHERH